MTNEEIRKEIVWVSGELRHVYELLVNGYVAERNHKKLADGLIAPQIRKLERMVNEL